ncbi:hypothetical protein K7X08_001545 [Anisodus acutangulus]|uniref:Uncharacterized protein n=1 Tax=Anisodus acutangulus TaxID=402998 RepID=A0A9Q1RKP3_9SOLA|nr:hypothetical protein K7X08_001545 [Anisodus acutangulus]
MSTSFAIEFSGSGYSFFKYCGKLVKLLQILICLKSCNLKSTMNFPLNLFSFFSSSDQRLQEELYKYLEARGVGKSFVDSLLLHLHRKVQGQYVDWLHKLQAIATPTE